MSTRTLLFPRKIPDYLRQDPLRSTECSVYDTLERNLPVEYAIFYSRPWWGLSPTGGEIDGEADFVIAHPEFGILILEVKGGGISYDPATERWTSRDRYGITHSIKNPVAQARTSKHRILEKVNKSPHWNRRRIRARHGIVLPHSMRLLRDLGADMPLSIFAFEEDFVRLSDWVKERMGASQPLAGGEFPPGNDGLRALTEILAQPFQLKSSLGTLVALEDRDIVALTDQQFHLLEGFRDSHRLAITGGAGTGKTLLAVEKACRLAQEGAETLLVCFNQPLACHLRRTTVQVQGLSVMTFHELCSRALVQTDGSGSTLPERPEALAELLRLAAREKPGKFDAIIVDEAQDFHSSWWDPLGQCLKDAQNGILYIFHDSRQKLQPWRNTAVLGAGLQPYRLTRNLRNTREIFDVAYPWFDDSFTVAAGPHGHAVEWHDLNSEHEAGEIVSRYVAGLVSSERMGLGQIAVLLPTAPEADALVAKGWFGRFPVQKAGEDGEEALTVDSIRRFKGLESSVAVVLLTGSAVPESELLYVALTRARSHLAIFADGKVNRALRNALARKE
jgi:hypothetical protein